MFDGNRLVETESDSPSVTTAPTCNVAFVSEVNVLQFYRSREKVIFVILMYFFMFRNFLGLGVFWQLSAPFSDLNTNTFPQNEYVMDMEILKIQELLG